jgi:hypothetical protein
MEFSEPRYDLDIRGENWIRLPKDRKHRFNVVIASNFFTSVDSVAKFGEKLQQAALYTKNRGLLIFVGPVSNSSKYRDVYNHLDQLVLGQDYGQGRYIGSCAKIGLPSSMQSHRWSDRYGKRLKRLLAMVLNVFEAQGVLGAMKAETRALLERAIRPEYNHESQWELHAYNRHSDSNTTNASARRIQHVWTQQAHEAWPVHMKSSQTKGRRTPCTAYALSGSGGQKGSALI